MIRLHNCKQTRAMKVHWLLGEIGVPFESHIWPFDRTLRQSEFLQLSPAGRVPSLEDGELTMHESGAIVEYLCERFPDSGLGRPPGHPERPNWLIWLHFSETIAQHLANLTQHHIFLREAWMRSPTVMRLERMRLEKTLGVVETTLERQDCLLASGFSAVDCCIGYCVYVARYFTCLDGFPNTRGYHERNSERPAFRATLPAPGEARLYEQDFYPVPDA
ncbi:MAG: glutathione S-transferase family protein [Proteobacteria bacterium]|nr:glutathione S-transferase family protein [Pseudomonadota bacterium]